MELLGHLLQRDAAQMVLHVKQDWNNDRIGLLFLNGVDLNGGFIGFQQLRQKQPGVQGENFVGVRR